MSERKISRKDFLNLAALAGTGALLGGCGLKAKQTVPERTTTDVQPIKTLIPTTTKVPIPSPEPTLTAITGETRDWVWERVGGVSKDQEREGKLATGQEYILVTREEGIELLEKPENKGKIILFGGPNEKTEIRFLYSTKNFIYATLIGISSVYVPTNGKFSLGEAEGHPLGIISFGGISVYFGLSDEEKLNLDAGGKPGSVGKYIYGHATKLDLFKDHRELGPVLIQFFSKEGLEITEGEVEQYFNENVLVTKNGKLVFLEIPQK